MVWQVVQASAGAGWSLCTSSWQEAQRARGVRMGACGLWQLSQLRCGRAVREARVGTLRWQSRHSAAVRLVKS
jgi:hypothetical protein